MIDHDRLNQAYAERRFYALQLEVGDRCEQGCSYCYMNALPDARNALRDDRIIRVLDEARLMDITVIEWLGGEPLLREGVFRLMEYAAGLGLRNNLWTGGLPLADPDTTRHAAECCRHGLIAVHLSTLDPQLYELLHTRRSAEDIKTILRSVERLLRLNYPSGQILNSVTFTGLQPAEDMIRTMEFFMNQYGILTSLNVYHTYLRPGHPAGELQRFIPSEKAVAEVYRHYRKILKTDELPMNCVNQQYCSATLAVLHNGFVTPCATIREEREERNVLYRSLTEIAEEHRDELIFDYMRDPAHRSDRCRQCRLSEICWGCRSRAYAAGRGIYGDDPRCFRMKKERGNHDC